MDNPEKSNIGSKAQNEDNQNKITQHRKQQKMSNTDPTKQLELNPDTREE
jgi:hypothetical protein